MSMKRFELNVYYSADGIPHEILIADKGIGSLDFYHLYVSNFILILLEKLEFNIKSTPYYQDEKLIDNKVCRLFLVSRRIKITNEELKVIEELQIPGIYDYLFPNILAAEFGGKNGICNLWSKRISDNRLFGEVFTR